MMSSVAHVLGSMMRSPWETSVTFFSAVCSLFSPRSEISANRLLQVIAHEAYRAVWGRETIHNFFQRFCLTEESEGREASVGPTQMPTGDMVSEQREDGAAVGMDLGWRIGADGHNRKPRQPTSVLCSPCQHLVLTSLVKAGSVCSQDLLNCWLVCEFSKALAHVVFSLSTEHTGSTHKKSDSLRTCSPSISPGSRLCLWTVVGVLISGRLFCMFLSVSQECVFAEIFFFLTILQTCEILPQFFTQSGKFKYL